MADRATDSAQELLQFLYLTPVGVVKFRADGAVDLMNPAASALLAPMAPNAGLGNFYTAMASTIGELGQEIAAFSALSGTIIDQRWLEAQQGAESIVLSLSVNRVNRGVYMAVLSDVTRIAKQDRALFADGEKFRAIFDHVRDYAIYTVTVDGVIDEWNPSVRRYAGWQSTDVLGARLDMFWRQDDLDRRSVAALLDQAAQIGSVETEGWQLKRDGSRLWGNTVITALPDADAKVRGFVIVSRDITERKRLEDSLQKLAIIDPLTGAYNRRQGDACVAAEFARRARGGQPFAVMMLDIDHFKLVNDRFGHQAGDTTLKALTGACRATLRAVDEVARWGGEEFLVVLPGTDAAAAMAAAERLRGAIAATNVSGPAGETIRITVSIGVATPTNNDPADLINRADLALYAAKAGGRNQVRLAG